MAKKELVPPGLTYLADNIISRHNILGAARGEGARWAKGIGFAEKSDTLFFAGCGYQYASGLESLMALIRRMDRSGAAEMTMSLASFQKRLGLDAAALYRRVMSRGDNDEAQVLRDAVTVLKKLGIEFSYLGEDEPCCGGLLYYAGLRSEFDVNARQVSDRFKSAGIKRIISIVPSCTQTLRNLVPASAGGNGVEVKHFTQIVAENISSHRLRFPRKVKVAFHDPCQLVRYLGLVEEPRRILRAIEGIELVETRHTSGECATCCGGGGGFEAVFPELSEILAVNRVKELLETGADIISTNCPGCILQLKAGLKELKAKDVEVLDLAQIVAMAMGV